MPGSLHIRLLPLSPLRLGPPGGSRGGIDTVLHSDTLFSALCQGMLRLGWLDEWLAATVVEQPAVRLTSAFPFSGETLFVPPPLSLWPPAGASPKVRWNLARLAPLRAVQQALRGETLAEDRWTIDAASECLLAIERSGGVHVPFRVSRRMAAAVDRMTGASEPHASACMEFAERAGLWFQAVFARDAAQELWTPRLGAVLRLLGDSGIGGERSRGWGRFGVSMNEDDSLARRMGLPEGGGGWWLLSLLSPGAAEPIDWTRGHYRVVERSGRTEAESAWGAPKLVSRMLEEGSVIAADAEPQGVTHDVAPAGAAHPVYRFGAGVALPFPLRGEA